METNLNFTKGSSDKFYRVTLVEDGSLYAVKVHYGRNGQTGIYQTKIDHESYDGALKIYNKTVNSKLKKGYQVKGNGNPIPTTPEAAAPQGQSGQTEVDAVLPQLLTEIDESRMEELLEDDEWCAQEKHDGERKVLYYRNGALGVTNKKGNPSDCPQHWVEDFKKIGYEQGLIIDGEAVGDKFYAFDIIRIGDMKMDLAPYDSRYEKLKGYIKNLSSIKLVVIANTTAEKKALFKRLKKNEKEGIVLKLKDAIYSEGRSDDYLKYKFYAEATCIVAAHNKQHSIKLALLNDVGKRVFVGNCTIPQKTEKPLVGSLVEIKYLYAYKEGSLYQPSYKGERNDQDTEDCKLIQLKYKSESGPVTITTEPTEPKTKKIKRKVAWK